MRRYLAIATAIALLAPTTLQARDLTFVSAGGAFQEAERKSYIEPFTAATGIPVKEDSFNGELAKIKTQVDSGAVTWDVVSMSSSALELGCEQGLFEKLDWARIVDPKTFIPAAVQECGIGMSAGATIMTYDKDKFSDGPTSWTAMWDLTKYPGTRGMRFSPRTTLEIALLADGVSHADLYKVLRTKEGVDRAFAKLDQIKPHIRWWKSGSELVQLLGSGEYALAASFYGRVFSLNASAKRNFAIVRSAGVLQDFTYYAIPTGSPNEAQAYDFLKFAAQPKIQANYVKFYPYGPGNKDAYPLIPEAEKANLLSPIGVDQNTIFEDVAFWSENLEALQQRFNVWTAN